MDNFNHFRPNWLIQGTYSQYSHPKPFLCPFPTPRDIEHHYRTIQSARKIILKIRLGNKGIGPESVRKTPCCANKTWKGYSPTPSTSSNTKNPTFSIISLSRTILVNLLWLRGQRIFFLCCCLQSRNRVSLLIRILYKKQVQQAANNTVYVRKWVTQVYTHWLCWLFCLASQYGSRTKNNSEWTKHLLLPTFHKINFFRLCHSNSIWWCPTSLEISLLLRFHSIVFQPLGGCCAAITWDEE